MNMRLRRDVWGLKRPPRTPCGAPRVLARPRAISVQPRAPPATTSGALEHHAELLASSRDLAGFRPNLADPRHDIWRLRTTLEPFAGLLASSRDFAGLRPNLAGLLHDIWSLRTTLEPHAELRAVSRDLAPLRNSPYVSTRGAKQDARQATPAN